MHEHDPVYGHRTGRSGLERGAEQAIAYLRGRSADHWLMFVAGIVIGLILG